MQSQAFEIKILEFQHFVFVFKNMSKINPKGKISLYWNQDEQGISACIQDKSHCMISEGFISKQCFETIQMYDLRITVDIESIIQVIKLVQNSQKSEISMRYESNTKILIFTLLKQINKSRILKTHTIPTFEYENIKSESIANGDVIFQLQTSDWNCLINSLKQKYARQFIVTCIFPPKGNQYAIIACPVVESNRYINYYLNQSAINEWSASKECYLQCKFAFLEMTSENTGSTGKTLVIVIEKEQMFVQHELIDSYVIFTFGSAID